MQIDRSPKDCTQIHSLWSPCFEILEMIGKKKNFFLEIGDGEMGDGENIFWHKRPK